MLIDDLEISINYKFKNINLLKEALTHSSYKIKINEKNNQNYERLEFLGDRILGLVLAEYFFVLFPDANEGSLNNYFQKYANQGTLALYAQTIHLSRFVKIQKGDNLECNKSILSDVVEAIIGSIYLDSSFANSKIFIINEIIKSNPVYSEPNKHSKTLLPEYCLDKYKCLPIYSLVNKSGTDHKPIFTVSVSVYNIKKVIGEGGNLKNAEEAAALKLLNILNKVQY